MSLAAVYSREHQDGAFHFGTSGYTMKRTFVLFDRESDSIWYPGPNGTLEAVAGPRQGDTVSSVVESPIVTLGTWLDEHPESTILLPPPHSKTVLDLWKSSTNSSEKTPARPEEQISPQ